MKSKTVKKKIADIAAIRERFTEIIDLIMVSEGVTISRLSRVLGFDASTIAKIMDGSTKGVSDLVYRGLEKGYRVNRSYIEFGIGEKTLPPGERPASTKDPENQFIPLEDEVGLLGKQIISDLRDYNRFLVERVDELKSENTELRELLKKLEPDEKTTEGAG